ncbi:MAG: right-handed parallel beta-helix repeat-containing protein [Saprospiraceae bacterium]
MKKIAFTSLLLALCASLPAVTRHIGIGQTYPTLTAAAAVALPGDTLLLHAGNYPGGLTITNLKGTANAWITIKNAPGEMVVFEGGGNAIQFVEPAYLHLIGLVFQHQTGNGVNTDDGGTYDTPAHHIIFEKCVFRDMSASGNNDLLKLSGLDHFEVRDCEFRNGSAGGSGVDMVGCHHGVIRGNRFEQMGSNAIQCKGGSEHVRIEGNFFKNCGQRTLNIGGSTGLAFFRPDTAHFEAAHVQVFSNIIIGSVAPVAFVGAVQVDVANNTIYRPEKWVTRILQETVDPNRFLECGDNAFRNNVIFLGNAVSTVTNIGPNTRPASFSFSNNLWYNFENPNWGGPDIPVAETNQILQADPLFASPATDNFSIPPGSPAAGAGLVLIEPKLDFLKKLFANPPSVGAVEANPISAVWPLSAADLQQWTVFPNPAGGDLWVQVDLPVPAEPVLELYDLSGRLVAQLAVAELLPGLQRVHFPVGKLARGTYFLAVLSDGKRLGGQLVVVGH